MIGSTRLLIRTQRTLNLDLSVQQHYFVVSPCKITSESCNHFNALDNVSVEGFKSICKIATGSGVGLGLRAIGCGPSFGIELQALSAIEISAQLSIAARLFLREFIACFLGVDGVLSLAVSGFSLGFEAGLGLVFGRVGDGQLQHLVRALLGMQAQGLPGQQAHQQVAQPTQAIGLEVVAHHTPSISTYLARRDCSGTVLRTWPRFTS